MTDGRLRCGCSEYHRADCSLLWADHSEPDDPDNHFETYPDEIYDIQVHDLNNSVILCLPCAWRERLITARGGAVTPNRGVLVCDHEDLVMANCDRCDAEIGGTT